MKHSSSFTILLSFLRGTKTMKKYAICKIQDKELRFYVIWALQKSDYIKTIHDKKHLLEKAKKDIKGWGNIDTSTKEGLQFIYADMIAYQVADFFKNTQIEFDERKILTAQKAFINAVKEYNREKHNNFKGVAGFAKSKIQKALRGET